MAVCKSEKKKKAGKQLLRYSLPFKSAEEGGERKGCFLIPGPSGLRARPFTHATRTFPLLSVRVSTPGKCHFFFFLPIF